MQLRGLPPGPLRDIRRAAYRRKTSGVVDRKWLGRNTVVPKKRELEYWNFLYGSGIQIQPITVGSGCPHNLVLSD